MKKNYFWVFFSLIILGCTYNFKGFSSRNIRSVAVPVFENKTSQYELESKLTKSVIDAFIQDNRLKVLDKSNAESILTGEILQYKREVFSYDDKENVKDYKVEVMVKLTYKDKSGKVLLSKELSEYYLYQVNETEESCVDALCSKMSLSVLKTVIE
ncbi:MAG: LPS assembly lipoprotein LptE [bacterium]|nr:LPS assembly lipoprotein LptE [bacterium]